MADRIGVIRKGQLVVVEEKDVLMRTLGQKQLSLSLRVPLDAVPAHLTDLSLELSEDGTRLVYTFDAQEEETGIAALMKRLSDDGIDFKDLHTSESSLEDIFVKLVHEAKEQP